MLSNWEGHYLRNKKNILALQQNKTIYFTSTKETKEQHQKINKEN